MKELALSSIAEKIGGKIVNETKADLIINDIVIGIRKIKQGTLIFDANRDKTLHPAFAHPGYPCGIITDRPVDFTGINKHVAVVCVPDVGQAYWKFIDFYRNLFTVPVIGVTGTCGKTTTKEMIRHILSGSFKVNATYKSYNALFRNLGYLLEIDDSTQAAVFEMGVAFPGDLISSCRYFKPQVGVITNIGIDHLKAFPSQDAYIKAKAELLEGLNNQGTLILNADDPNIKKIDLAQFKGNVVHFGFGDPSHFKLSNVRHGNGTLTFSLQYENISYPISIPGHGEFNVYNAAAAIAAANAAGFPIDQAGTRLASFQNVEKHCEFKPGMNGSTIIDDTWSTNPTSAAAALNILKSHAQGRKTVAVLGKMSLLGRQSAEYHFKTGEKVAEIGIDHLIVIGDGADNIGHGALHRGMNPGDVHFCMDSGSAYEVLGGLLNSNTIVLVKTSMMASYSDLMNKITLKHP